VRIAVAVDFVAAFDDPLRNLRIARH
jgi:hypothetical protein